MNAPRTARPPRRAEDGFVLVTVLWILGALATLVIAYSVYLSATAAASAVRGETFTTDSLAVGAVELAAHRLVTAPKAARPTAGTVSFQAGRARIEARFREEGARIDLNAAPKELLASLFITLGARPEAAEVYGQAIVDWRSPDVGTRSAEAYRDAGLNYGPRGAPFVHVDELWLVAGLPEPLVAAALPSLTVYSGHAEVNARDADDVVRDAVALMARGAGGAGATIGLDGRQAATVPVGAAEPSDAVQVLVRVDRGKGRVQTTEAVILLRDFGDAPYRVLTWRTDARSREAQP